MAPRPRLSLAQSALIQLREKDRAAGIDPTTPSPVIQLRPPGPPPDELHIPAPDWHQELADRARAEAELHERARTQAVTGDLERLECEQDPARRRWHA
jgi:hypothetical protein